MGTHRWPESQLWSIRHSASDWQPGNICAFKNLYISLLIDYTHTFDALCPRVGRSSALIPPERAFEVVVLAADLNRFLLAGDVARLAAQSLALADVVLRDPRVHLAVVNGRTARVTLA